VPPAIASANRIAAAMMRFRSRRAIVEASRPDARSRAYALAPGFAPVLRRWVAMIVSAGAPFSRLRPAEINKAGMHQLWCGDFLLATLEGGGSLKAGPQAERRQSRQGGSLLYFESLRRGFIAGEPPQFSRKGFAQRFGLSRSHVIDMVAELERSGWASPGDAVFAPTPAALAGGRQWLMRFLAISTATLDGNFAQIVTASREQVRGSKFN